MTSNTPGHSLAAAVHCAVIIQQVINTALQSIIVGPTPVSMLIAIRPSQAVLSGLFIIS